MQIDVDKVIRKHFRVKRRDNLPYTGFLKSLRRDLYKVFAQADYKKGVEVGSWTGTNAIEIFTEVPNIDLTLVDPWAPFSSHNQETMNKIHRRCVRRTRKWEPTILRKTSEDAVKDFEDGSLDFVYIDAMHDFDHVMIDIIKWAPKVRVGGIVSGHDYFFGYQMGIIGAVHAYVKEHNISAWYVTGGAHARKEVMEVSSFFWVKK